MAARLRVFPQVEGGNAGVLSGFEGKVCTVSPLHYSWLYCIITVLLYYVLLYFKRIINFQFIIHIIQLGRLYSKGSVGWRFWAQFLRVLRI